MAETSEQIPTKARPLCNWMFASSPMGAQHGYWWTTDCGHRVSGTTQLPHRCDFCGRGVTDADSITQERASVKR